MPNAYQSGQKGRVSSCFVWCGWKTLSCSLAHSIVCSASCIRNGRWLSSPKASPHRMYLTRPTTLDGFSSIPYPTPQKHRESLTQLSPSLGRAGRPYCRSVLSLTRMRFSLWVITYICTPNGASSIRMTIVKMPTECSQARDSSRISTLIILGRSIFVRPASGLTLKR